MVLQPPCCHGTTHSLIIRPHKVLHTPEMSYIAACNHGDAPCFLAEAAACHWISRQQDSTYGQVSRTSSSSPTLGICPSAVVCTAASGMSPLPSMVNDVNWGLARGAGMGSTDGSRSLSLASWPSGNSIWLERTAGMWSALSACATNMAV